MSIRFIIGRAGSGKTHHCLEAVRARLRENPIDGPRLILLVPEQAALQTQRAIVAPADIAGSHRAEVLPFERLADRIFETTGSGSRRALTDLSRTMVLRHLIAQHAGKLQYYRRVDRLAGFIDQLNSTIREFMQEAVEPAALTENLAAMSLGDGAHRAKMHDLALIYRAYREFLGDRVLDPSLSLELARQRLPRCAWLHGAELWVDGFASFTRQELLTLIELMRLCTHTDITLLTDPALLMTNSASRVALARAELANQELLGAFGSNDSAELFGHSVKVYHDLVKTFLDHSFELEPPLVQYPAALPRFVHSPSLAHLESRLFRRGESDQSASTTEHQVHHRPPTEPPSTVELVQLPTRRDEVRFAVARVATWVREQNYRYREIAILLRDPSPYHDLISAALTSHDIPFFIDRRRPTAHHPLVELLRAVVSLAANDFQPQTVQLALKTDLLGLTTDQSDELENYLIAHAIRGFSAWQTGDWTSIVSSPVPDRKGRERAMDPHTLDFINQSRRLLVEAFQRWMQFASAEASQTGAEWIEEIVRLFSMLNIDGTLRQWADSAQERGKLDDAEEHEQIGHEIGEFLRDLALAFEDAPLTVTELVEVLEAGLRKFTLGMTPPTLDQVLVGAVDRSRHPDLKAAILLGLNDSVFPLVQAEDSVLNDDDHAMLIDAGVAIGPPLRDRTLDEAMLLYIAVTRPSEALVITHAATDDKGQPLPPSRFLRDLQTAYPELGMTRVANREANATLTDVQNWRDLIKGLVEHYRRDASTDGVSQSAVWNAVYESVRPELPSDEDARHVLSALREPAQARLSKKAINQLIHEPFRTSVSQLEKFAECPFKHFAKYGLNLHERPTANIEPVDLGRFQHALLEDFIRSVGAGTQSLASLSDSELKNQLVRSCAAVSQTLAEDGAMAHRRQRYLIERSTVNVVKAIRAQQRMTQAGRFRPYWVEKPFGYDLPDSLPALRITTPKDRTVTLRGYIDRVDLAEDERDAMATVIDYKATANKSLDLSSVFHGLTLQLLSYLLVVAEHAAGRVKKPVHPAAALYVSLSRRYDRLDQPDRQSAGEIQQEGSFQPRGLIAADIIDALESAYVGGRSPLFSFRRNNDGRIGDVDRTDGAARESFHALLDLTRTKFGELADGIMDGNVAIHPFRMAEDSPCTHCEYKSVCRFESGLSPVRRLERLKRSAIFERLSESSQRS